MRKFRLVLYIILVSLTIVAIIKIPDLIKINEVKCQSQYGLCNLSLNDRLTGLKTDSYRKTRKELSNILNGNILVNEYRIHYSYPGIFKVYIIERNPRYALHIDSLSKYYLVDKSGMVLGSADKVTLPTISTDNTDVSEGKVIDEKELFAFSILELIYTSYRLENAKIEGSSLVVELDGNLKIIFPLEGNKNTLVGSMFFIMSKMKSGEIGGSKVAIINLSYKSPVLTLE